MSPELTEKQLTLLQTFREKVDNVLTDEQRNNAFLLRWLKGREWNLDRAEIMLRNSINWRKENHMDDIIHWKPNEALRLFYPVGQCGFDNDGCPVLIVPFGRSDVRGLIEAASKENFIRYTYQILEQCLCRIQNHDQIDNEVTQMVVIFDMKGLSFTHLAYKTGMEVLLEIVKGYEANYPETLKKAFAVNAPAIFTMLYGIVTPCMGNLTLKKVSIFGYNDEKWKKALLEVIPASQLPKHWGGTREENDEFCSSLVCMGGKVPDEYLQGAYADKEPQMVTNTSEGIQT